MIDTKSARSGNKMILERPKSRPGCVTCGITVPSALTKAHVHEGFPGHPDRTFSLCWTCHRLYDHDIISSVEVEEAERAWQCGLTPDATQWFRRIEQEIADGTRAANKARQHKGGAARAVKKKKARARAIIAWKTRKARQHVLDAADARELQRSMRKTPAAKRKKVL